MTFNANDFVSSCCHPAEHHGGVMTRHIYRIIISYGVLVVFLYEEVSAQITQNVTITVSDGVVLDATITWPIPITFPIPNSPGVVLIHGFGGNKTHMSEIALAAAVNRYASIAYSVRGQGNSGGLSTVGGSRERQDLLEVILYFRNISFVDGNRIGVMGGSQGGIHSWMAAIHQMPGVRVVAPLIATPDFAHALVPNGCVRHGLPREMTIGTVRYAPSRDVVKEHIIADRYDSVLTYINQRDLAHLVGNVQVPVIQGIGWADYLFPVNGGIRARENLVSRNIPIWSYYGTNSHGEPIDTPHVTFFFEKITNWFDHWLKGHSLAQDSVPLVFYADDRPGWPLHTTAVWPPLPASTLRLYITASGLSRNPVTDIASHPFSLSYDTSYTPHMAWDGAYGGPAFVNAFTSAPVRLVSDVLEQDLEVTGSPSGRIHVESNAGKFQAHVRYYDVWLADTTYVWRLMSRAVNGVRNNVPGTIHEIQLEGHALSHIVPAGHRIGIEVTSLDMLTETSASTIPFFASTQSMLHSTPSMPSYVDIPVVGVISSAPMPPTIGAGYTLRQNYPNPFNPATTIQYSLDRSAHVELKVFDMLGREVAVLVDHTQSPGVYEVRFDGSGLSSGVYVYRLLSEGSVQTKRMVLLR
jgi:predicted acyl esterase